MFWRSAGLWFIVFFARSGLRAAGNCPIVGDTVSLTGQVSLLKTHDLQLPDIHLKTFPNNFQPICVSVPPYIGLGVGRVDRVVAIVSHIWLVSESQRMPDGSFDWAHPGAMPLNRFVRVSGKIIGQRENAVGDSVIPGGSEITLEFTKIEDVDLEIKRAVADWTEGCSGWIRSQVEKWEEAPAARAKIVQHEIEPFARVNGIAYPKCAAILRLSKNEASLGDRSIARYPWVVNNIGDISLSGDAGQ